MPSYSVIETDRLKSSNTSSKPDTLRLINSKA